MKHRIVQEDGETRVYVKGPRIEADIICFTFTNEGLIVDSIIDDEVDGTTSATYDEIEADLC
jgi:hypothetical protein